MSKKSKFSFDCALNQAPVYLYQAVHPSPLETSHRRLLLAVYFQSILLLRALTEKENASVFSIVATLAKARKTKKRKDPLDIISSVVVKFFRFGWKKKMIRFLLNQHNQPETEQLVCLSFHFLPSLFPNFSHIWCFAFRICCSRGGQHGDAVARFISLTRFLIDIRYPFTHISTFREGFDCTTQNFRCEVFCAYHSNHFSDQNNDDLTQGDDARSVEYGLGRGIGKGW